MAQFVITVLSGLIAAAYGLVALWSPHRIQQWWMSERLRRKVAMKIYGESLKSGTYILHLRISGAVAVGVSILLFYFAFSGHQ